MVDGTSSWAFKTVFISGFILSVLNIYLFSDNLHAVLINTFIIFAAITALLTLLRVIEKKTKKGILDADVVDNGIEAIFGKGFENTYNDLLKKRKTTIRYNFSDELYKNTLSWGVNTYINDVLAYYNASKDKEKFVEKYKTLSTEKGISSTLVLLMEYEQLDEIQMHMYNKYGIHDFLIEEIKLAKEQDDKDALKEYLEEGYDLETGLHVDDKYKGLRWDIYSNRVPFAEVAYLAYEYANK